MSSDLNVDDARGVVLANEFASVHLTVVQRRHGKVLEVLSSRSDVPLALDATALDLLAQTPLEDILALAKDHGLNEDELTQG